MFDLEEIFFHVIIGTSVVQILNCPSRHFEVLQQLKPLLSAAVCFLVQQKRKPSV